MTQTKIVHGVVRGATIELAEDLGIAEGQRVVVQVSVGISLEDAKEGILRTAGALVDDAEWDTIMEEIQRDRRRERRESLNES